MPGCVLHTHFSKLLSLMGNEDTYNMSRESLARILEQHATHGCCTGPQEPPEPSASSPMGLSTADLAEAMGTSEATAGRRIRAGWFGEPKGLRPNGAHYCIPHDVAEDVFKNGPLCRRGPGEEPANPEAEVESATGDRSRTPTEGHPGAQDAPGAETEVEVPSGSEEPSATKEADRRRATTSPSADEAVPADGAAREIARKERIGSPDDGAEIEGPGSQAADGAESESVVDPLLDALADWEEVYRE